MRQWKVLFDAVKIAIFELQALVRNAVQFRLQISSGSQYPRCKFFFVLFHIHAAQVMGLCAKFIASYMEYSKSSSISEFTITDGKQGH
jgi:hypothetical protein